MYLPHLVDKSHSTTVGPSEKYAIAIMVVHHIVHDTGLQFLQKVGWGRPEASCYIAVIHLSHKLDQKRKSEKRKQKGKAKPESARYRYRTPPSSERKVSDLGTSSPFPNTHELSNR